MTALDLDLVPEPPSSPAVVAARQRRALVVGLGGGRPGESVSAKSPFTERRLRATDTVPTHFVDPLPGVDVAGARGRGPLDRMAAEPPCGLGDAPGSADRRGLAVPAAAGPVSAPTPGAALASTEPSAAMAVARNVAADAAAGKLAADPSARGVAAGPATRNLPADPAAGTGAADPAARTRAADPAAGRAVPPVSPPDAATATSAPSSAVGMPPRSASASGLRLDDALVVPAGALMRGYLRCHALLLVGDIVGNVHCTAGPVVVRSGASLKGRLVATGDVYVCGTVGDSGGGTVITTRGKLTLAPGARVDGDVRSGWLDVYDGAALNGLARRCED